MVILKASSMGSNVPADSNSKTVGQNQHDICTITKITGIIALATQQPNTMLQHCSCMSAHLRFSPSLMNSATFLRSPPCHTTPRPTPTALQRDTTQQLYCVCPSRLQWHSKNPEHPQTMLLHGSGLNPKP